MSVSLPTVSSSTTPRIRVVPARIEHAAAMADFFRDVGWSSDASAESVRQGREREARENPGAFEQEAPTFLVLDDERVIGYVSSIPHRVWCGEREVRTYWVKGLMVREEFRNGPIGYLVLKEAARHLRPALVSTVHPASCRLFRALGFDEQGVLSNHLRLLKPARMLSRLDARALGLDGVARHVARVLAILQRTRSTGVVGGVLAGLQGAWLAVARPRDSRLRVEVGELPPPPAALDALWQRTRGTMVGASVRDARYIAWRYVTDRESRYRFLSAYEDETLVGLAVLRRPRAVSDGRLRGLRIATISDLVLSADQRGIAAALVAACERDARACDADAVLCSTSHPGLRRVLARRAFLPTPGNVHFFVRDDAPRTRLPRGLDQWWLTRGDGESDGTF